ncbi:protein BANP-like isoform X3 [Haliotis rufescens]|uniref:protein BANP-like isoform X3 n=1 Tax=Haliotis rufescens TaxID=6454 RepID=UPI001EAFF3E8|nr:protein BANP-like isoform X3 [Haliotis rufescens]
MDCVRCDDVTKIMSTDGSGERIPEAPRIIAVETSSVVTNLDESSNMDGGGDDDDGPLAKRRRLEDSELCVDQSIKQILFNINKAICMRLETIENKLDTLSQRSRTVEEKVEQLLIQARQAPGASLSPNATGSRRGAVIVGLPQNGTRSDTDGDGSVDGSVQNLGPNVTLITLNTEEDYPNGVWLGEESNPEMRVRVPITPSDLLHVHSNCRTPEKMALTMLDYLFDRETQACSNLSGMGKHGKKQLDPLMIYGIRCHLIHRFGITENDWHRIKQNIDSKCRTAFRRKQRGMPLTAEVDSIQQAVSTMQGEAIQQGEIQILHATPEQISQLQQAHHIQILQGDQVIGQIQQGDVAALGDGIQVATVTTDSGEVLHIQQAPAVVPEVTE